MSNLGMYQKFTTWSKKVGGPLQLLILAAGSGYVIGRTFEAIIKKGVKDLRNQDKENKRLDKHTTKIYTVTAIGNSNDELELNPGDKYKILELDKDAILIEKIDASDNPHFVSADFLRSISDFK